MSTTSPESQPKAPSRAGRDLKAAIGVGVGLAALIIATLTINKVYFLIVVMLAIAVGVWEIRQALRNAAVTAPLLAWCLTMALTIVWRAAGSPEGAGQDALGGIFIATYPPLLAGFAALLLAPEDGVGRMYVFVIITVGSDIGGYAAGVLFGKHPMAPSISPKKSWEGFAGSVFLCIVTGAVTVVVFLDKAWWIGILLGVGVAICATIGDLMESLIKRDLGVKDMSNILPGHGGIMDRLDSLVVVAPVVWAVLTLLAAPVL